MKTTSFLFLLLSTMFLLQCTSTAKFPVDQNQVTSKKEKKVERTRYYKNGLKATKKKGKWGYVDQSKEVVIPFKFSDAGDFITNTAYVGNGEKFALIDIKGNLVTEWKYDTLFNAYKQFVGRKNSQLGMVDSTGKEFIPFIYEDYNGGYKGQYVFKKNGRWGTVGDGYEDFDNDPTFLSPEVMPKFPGCPKVADEKEWKSCADKKMLTYIYQQIMYPAEARRLGVSGTVVISFLVNKEGNIEQAEIAREIGGGCGAECLRIINSMPRWTPGEHDGEIVVSRFNLPVKFRLE